MKLVLITVLLGLVAADDRELGDRIAATEQECDRLFKLNQNWNTEAQKEEMVQYIDLYFLCDDSLTEDKFAYIDRNNLDMNLYSDKDKFPIATSNGEVWVTKPPQRTQKQVETMKHKLVGYIEKFGGKNNPLSMLVNGQSRVGQQIVDQQVKCEFLALLLLKHPEVKDTEADYIMCLDELNCMKERFMTLHHFTREQYPKYFPIMYKNRGTMINTPPVSEKSLCVQPVQHEEYKKELSKWVNKVGEKLFGIKESGSDLIQKLKGKGTHEGGKVLTKEELNDLMNEAESVTFTNDDDNDDDNNIPTYKVYRNDLIEKISDLEAKGLKIAHSKLKSIKPGLDTVGNVASATGEHLMELESKLKSASKAAIQGAKHEMNIAEHMAKVAAEKTKEEGSVLLGKLVSDKQEKDHSKEHENIGGNSEDTDKDSNNVLVSLINKFVDNEYLPNNYDTMAKPSISKILKEMGGRDEDGKDKLSDSELKQMAKSMKNNVKEKAKELHISKNQVVHAAAVVKGIMHSLLNLAEHGHGVVGDMKAEEIETARSLVDQLVDYATDEIVDDGLEDEDDSSSDTNGNAVATSGHPTAVTGSETKEDQAENDKDSSSESDSSDEDSGDSKDKATDIPKSEPKENITGDNVQNLNSNTKLNDESSHVVKKDNVEPPVVKSAIPIVGPACPLPEKNKGQQENKIESEKQKNDSNK